jgi:molybdopterin-guanine dinucleotide biosynthesis protein A
LGQFLAAGGRKIDAWTQLHPTAIVPFDDARAFSNANTLAELQQLEQP